MYIYIYIVFGFPEANDVQHLRDAPCCDVSGIGAVHCGCTPSIICKIMSRITDGE
jgi:hypothetical protein